MSLRNYFPASSHPDKAAFDNLLDTIYFHTEIFSYIAAVKSGHYFCVSPSFTQLTGHPYLELEEKGVQFYMEHVPKEDVLGVMEKQAETFKEVTKPGFNPELPNFIEMQSRFRKADGSYIRNIALGTALSYLPNGEFDIALVSVIVQSPDESKNDQRKAEAATLLTKAKTLFRKIYPQQPFTPDDALTEIVFDVEPQHILTPKEKEVLGLIAEGLSTKEIAQQFSMSENTVERHRKNMLQKLKAANVAELIQKAGKLYWLNSMEGSKNNKLTPREEDILKLLAKGMTSARIAKALSIEENTVETHRKNILLKFEAKNIAELIKKASKVYWLE